MVRRSTVQLGSHEVEADTEAGDYGTSGTSRPKMKRRHSFTVSEIMFPSKDKTWTIDDDNETMDNVSIVINLLADLSPAGILPLSFGMAGTGYIPSMVLLILFAAAAGYMMYLISRTIEISQEKSFNKMWEKVVGSSTRCVPVAMVFAVCFGCCLAYACMFGDLFAGCMPAFGVNASRTVCLIVLGIFPLLPLCMLKDLSLLAPTSFAALVAVLFTIVMMAVRKGDGSYAPGGEFFTEAPPDKGSHLFTFGISSLLLVNGLAVAFLCHYNGCKYYREYKEHTPGKFGNKVSIAFGAVSVIFALAMTLGYATFGSLSDGVILNNYSTNDIFANFARLGMGAANVCSFPLMFSGLREQALALIVEASPAMKGTCDLVWFQNVFSACMLMVITVVAILVTDASLVVGLVGSICGSATIYVIPCILFDRASTLFTPSKYSKAEQFLVRLIGCVGVFLMVAGAVATLAL